MPYIYTEIFVNAFFIYFTVLINIFHIKPIIVICFSQFRTSMYQNTQLGVLQDNRVYRANNMIIFLDCNIGCIHIFFMWFTIFLFV